jgi:Protein of unknown function (DUF3148)
MSQKFNIGTIVRVIELPTYLKTADPIPMLRPSSMLELGSTVSIVDRKPGNYWVVNFGRSSYLLEEQYLAAIDI